MWEAVFMIEIIVGFVCIWREKILLKEWVEPDKGLFTHKRMILTFLSGLFLCSS